MYKKLTIRFVNEEEQEQFRKIMSSSNKDNLPESVWAKNKILSSSVKIEEKIVEVPKVIIKEVIKEVPSETKFPITLLQANRFVQIAKKHNLDIPELLEELERNVD